MTFSSEHYLAKSLEALTQRCIVISPNLKILASAPSDCLDERQGRPGQSCYEVFYDRDVPCHDCGVLEALSTKRTTVRQIMDHQGKTNRVQTRYYLPMSLNEDERVVAVVDPAGEFFQEVEAELSSANVFLKSLIMSSVDGIIASDMTGRILIFNEAASQITGYDQNEALGTLNIKDIYFNGGAYDIMKRLRADSRGGSGKLKNYRVDIQRKDGSAVPIDLSASVVYDCGQEAATVGFFYDLTEKLRLERKLQKAQLQLIQAEKMGGIGKLAAGVAHQLNNPIGGIALYSQILMEEHHLEPEAKADLQRIIDDAERCRQIVKELLDFARQSNLDIRANDVNGLVSRTIFLLRNQPIFHHIDIIQNLAEGLPPVLADLQQLGHVFMNIVLNAADAMQGRGRLTIVTRQIKGQDLARIEISDTGPGIPEHALPHIFEPFFTTKQPGQGTGLGLSVAYGVVESHGGRLTVETSPERGTTFIIELQTEPRTEETRPTSGSIS